MICPSVSRKLVARKRASELRSGVAGAGCSRWRSQSCRRSAKPGAGRSIRRYGLVCKQPAGSQGTSEANSVNPVNRSAAATSQSQCRPPASSRSTTSHERHTIAASRRRASLNASATHRCHPTADSSAAPTSQARSGTPAWEDSLLAIRSCPAPYGPARNTTASSSPASRRVRSHGPIRPASPSSGAAISATPASLRSIESPPARKSAMRSSTRSERAASGTCSSPSSSTMP